MLAMTIKNEIIDRMELLQLHKNVIEDFRQNNKLNRSENFGMLYWLTDEEKQLVKTFEKENAGTIVYHIIKTITQDLEIVYDLLYVTEDIEDWTIDREYLQDDLVLSYTITENPESGFIKIKKINGSLIREY